MPDQMQSISFCLDEKNRFPNKSKEKPFSKSFLNFSAVADARNFTWSFLLLISHMHKFISGRCFENTSTFLHNARVRFDDDVRESLQRAAL